MAGIRYINRSQTHECGNWDCGHAVPFLEIVVSNFRRWFFTVWTKGWTSLEPKDDMEDKDRPGDDALQEEQEPCRQADHGSQTFPSCTQSHRMFLNLVFLHCFLALCPYNVHADSFTCDDCNDSSMSFYKGAMTGAFCHEYCILRLVKIQISEIGASLQPYCRLAMTAAFCHDFYKASEKFRYLNWEPLCNLAAGLPCQLHFSMNFIRLVVGFLSGIFSPDRDDF
jgi:hypothetical protein